MKAELNKKKLVKGTDAVVPLTCKATEDYITGKMIDNQFYQIKSNGSYFKTPIEPKQGQVYEDIKTNRKYVWGGDSYIEFQGGKVSPDITIVNGDVQNLPDNEDIESVNDGLNNVLRFKDKVYAPANYSGLGRKYLRKNVVNDKNVLTQAMMQDANTIYVIQYDYDLNGHSITIPTGCTLQFDGGSLNNGTLVGDLQTIEPIDIKYFGVKYGSETYAAANSTALNILSGITNDILLQVSDEVWLGGKISVTMKSINLEGNGNTMHIDNFDGFIVSDGINVNNLRVVTKDWDVSNSYFNKFVEITNVIKPSNIYITNCYFKGSMRVCNATNIADGVTENDSTVVNLEVCLDNVIIKGNTLENIACRSGAPLIILLSDSNFHNVEIKDNKVHNFFGTLFSAGITNDSIYSDYIDKFTAAKGRQLLVDSNIVSNDLEFKPWTKTNQKVAYFCFILAERGSCIYTNNSITNIIGNDADNPVYDSYMSVDYLYYANNYIKNVANLSGSYNEIFKSKGGISPKRYYLYNTYILEDLSSVFEIDFTSIHYRLINTLSKFDNLILTGNNIDFIHLKINRNYLLETNNLLVNDNIIHLRNVTLNNIDSNALFPLYVDGETATFKNNQIIVDSSKSVIPILLGQINSSDTRKITVHANNNTLKNIALTNVDTALLVGTCDNNYIDIDYNAIANTALSYAYFRKRSDLIMKGNEISVTNAPTTIKLGQQLMNLDLIVNAPGTSNIYAIDTMPEGISHIYIELYNEANECILLSEVNITKTEGNVTMSGYDSSMQFVSSTAARTNLYNFKKTNTVVQFNGNLLTLYRYPTKVRIKLSYITVDAEKFTLHPNNGVSAKRPTLTSTDAGFNYWDTTLGKMIAWNGSTWVNLDGTALT